jgi:hypothetical protein
LLDLFVNATKCRTGQAAESGRTHVLMRSIAGGPADGTCMTRAWSAESHHITDRSLQQRSMFHLGAEPGCDRHSGSGGDGPQPLAAAAWIWARLIIGRGDAISRRSVGQVRSPAPNTLHSYCKPQSGTQAVLLTCWKREPP